MSERTDDTPNEADAMTVPSALVHGLDENWRCAACDSSAGDRSKSSDSDVLTQKQAGLVNGPAAAPLAPFTPGSNWTGPGGTVYDVVRPEEVGNRRRWWIWGAETARPEDSEELHWDALDEISGGPPNCALVIRHLPDRLRASLRSLLGLPADIDDEAVIEGVKRFGEQWKALRDQELERLIAAEDALAETREKLAASDLAREALRDHWNKQADRIREIGREASVPTTGEPWEVTSRLALGRAEALGRAKQAERKLARAKDQIGRMKLAAKPARKAKPLTAREPATPAIKSIWIAPAGRHVAIVPTAPRKTGRWVSYRYESETRVYTTRLREFMRVFTPMALAIVKRSADRRLEKLQRLESERDAKPAKDKVPTAVMRGLRLICTAGAVEDAGINNGSDTHEDIVAARDWLEVRAPSRRRAVRKKPPAKAKRKGGR